MPPHLIPELPVPILGQPATVHTILVTAVFTCACSPEHPQTVAVDQVVMCPTCGDCWTIGELHYNKAPRRFHINMGKVIDAAPPPRPA